MLKKDYTAKLLNLEDVIITKVENISEEVYVYRELPRTKHRCPACGALTDRVHDYRMQIIRYFKCVSFKPTRLPKDSVLPYIKIVPERFTPTRPNYLCFVSTPTIDIEP